MALAHSHVILLGGAIGVSFVKVEGRPLGNIIFSAFGFYWKPQTYIWKSEERHDTGADTKGQEGGRYFP